MTVSLTPVDPFTGRPLGPTRTFATRTAEAAARNDEHDPIPTEPDALMAWVGYDPDRAKAAIVAEADRDQPRDDLLRRLTERTGR